MAQKKQFAASKLGGTAAEATAAAHHGGIVGNFAEAGEQTATATRQHGAFTGNFTEAVADPQPTPTKQPGQARAIPQGPALQQVRPGDLITAQFVNNLVLAIENLRDRLGDIEALVEDARTNNRVEDMRANVNHAAAD